MEGLGASSMPAHLVQSVEAGVFIIDSCVFRMCNLLLCPQLARSPSTPAPHHAQTASNAASISSLADIRCALHSVSLIFVNRIPSQKNLCVLE